VAFTPAGTIEEAIELSKDSLRGSVMSDVMGVSGRERLLAIIGGESEPTGLAELARGGLRRKIPRLQQAARIFLT